MNPFNSLFLILFFLSDVTPHANLRTPTPRTGMAVGNGKKLVNILTYQDDNCGANIAGGSGDPGPQNAVVTYQEGETITVEWDTTISHPSDPGVRFAVAFAGEIFSDNILASNLDAGGNGVHSTQVKLPSGKSGDAVLQFSWVSTADGGSYIGK